MAEILIAILLVLIGIWYGSEPTTGSIVSVGIWVLIGIYKEWRRRDG